MDAIHNLGLRSDFSLKRLPFLLFLFSVSLSVSCLGFFLLPLSQLLWLDGPVLIINAIYIGASMPITCTSNDWFSSAHSPFRPISLGMRVCVCVPMWNKLLKPGAFQLKYWCACDWSTRRWYTVWAGESTIKYMSINASNRFQSHAHTHTHTLSLIHILLSGSILEFHL